MGSRKHKKHKSERNDKNDDYCMDRPSALKLILKVNGNNSTPEYGNDSPAEGCGTADDELKEKHRKSKKKKKKKDREKRHKHHKEKRHRHRDESSQEPLSNYEENSSFLQESILNYVGITTENSPANKPITKSLIAMKREEIITPSPSSSPTKSVPDIILNNSIAGSPGSASTSTSTLGQPLTPKQIDGSKTPSSLSESGREPRTCVLKLKQSKSPLIKLVDHLLRSLEKRDPHQFFAWPVTDDIAPGYSKIITNPMDFSTMRQKIEDNEYLTLQEFVDDFKLMCENAIKYNHVDTVYHKAAKRLLHLGGKILQPENLMRSLKPLSGYMRELTAKELGFELGEDHNENDNNIVDSGDEGASTGADEPTQAQIEEEERRKAIRLENDPKSRFEPYIDDLTPDEIFQEVQKASRMIKKRLTAKQRANRMGFLRQLKDGTTTLNIFSEGEKPGAERVVTIGGLIGKLENGTGQIQGFREDRRNIAKMVKTLNYGSFSSFAPIYDSRFSNLSKEETDLILSTYGDETGAEYAESIIDFTKDSSYANILASRLLDFLTQGEHSKAMANLNESFCQKIEQAEIEQKFPETISMDDEEYEKYKKIKIDFNKLKTLSELNIDVTFLDSMEEDMKYYEMQQKLKDQLITNLSIIEKLQLTQHERLSQTLPIHLANVTGPGNDENQLAQQVSNNIANIAKRFPPSAIAEPYSLRKAMGMSNVGLPPIPAPKLIIPPILQVQCNPIERTSDTTHVPMDIDADTIVSHTTNTTVDLESELREFLENGSGLTGSHTDDNSIEQMLLN